MAYEKEMAYENIDQFLGGTPDVLSSGALTVRPDHHAWTAPIANPALDFTGFIGLFPDKQRAATRKETQHSRRPPLGCDRHNVFLGRAKGREGCIIFIQHKRMIMPVFVGQWNLHCHSHGTCAEGE